MDILEDITTELANKSNPISAAGAAFELVRQKANQYAVPESEMFAAWASVTIAACDGRNALSCPVVVFPQEASVATQLPEDVAAGILAALATTLQRSLNAAASLETNPDTRRGLHSAAEAASEIRELLATDS